MDWHPLGHILASGSNDRATRFWTRPRPGDASYMDDKWHIGQEAAEARGTYNKAQAARQREQEEEEEDEADALPDQQFPGKSTLLPGLPGLSAARPAFPDGTSTGGAQPFTVPNFTNGAPPPLGIPGANGAAPPMDPERIKAMFGGQMPQFPPPGTNGAPPPGFAPIPGFQPPPGFQASPGFPPLPPGGFPGMHASSTPTPTGGDGGSIRRRGPLPSQEESLKAEIRQGRYTKAR